MQIKIGADPEFFVKRFRHIVSAHEFEFGTKTEPMQTPNGFIQIDGIALECNVTPSSTKEEFVTNVSGVMLDLQEKLQDNDPNASIAIKPSIFLGKTKLGALPMYAAELGCRPDMNAWTGKRNPTPDPRTPFRTASGHLHIGWTKDADPHDKSHFETCRKIVRELDYCVGMPSLLWDKDDRRRKLYGQAGAFRVKPYGLEYRVLSNAWCRTERLSGWVFDAAMKAATTVLNGLSVYEDIYGNLAQSVINQNKRNWPGSYKLLAEEVLQ